jgi:hypothetical protein
MNTIVTNIGFYYNLYYYRFVSPYLINHYNVINKLIAYKSLGNRLLLNDPDSASEVMKLFENQNYIIDQIVNDIRYLRTKTTFYIDRPYHIERHTDAVIKILTNDILEHNL